MVQLKMYEEMGFKVDHASSIYKSFRLKILGTTLYFFIFLYFPVGLPQSRILIYMLCIHVFVILIFQHYVSG